VLIAELSMVMVILFILAVVESKVRLCRVLGDRCGLR
jgi:hypothetical protein